MLQGPDLNVNVFSEGQGAQYHTVYSILCIQPLGETPECCSVVPDSKEPILQLLAHSVQTAPSSPTRL